MLTPEIVSAAVKPWRFRVDGNSRFQKRDYNETAKHYYRYLDIVACTQQLISTLSRKTFLQTETNWLMFTFVMPHMCEIPHVT